MGIHDQGYRTFKGKIGGRFDRIWAIFIQDFTFRIKQRWTIVLMILTYTLGVLPTVLLTYFMFIPAIIFGDENPDVIFLLYFSLLFIWVIIYTSFVGSSIISNDMRNNAVILYFSRPLTQLDYFLGKFLSLFTLVLMVTLIPGLLISVSILGLTTETLLELIDIPRTVFTFIAISIVVAVCLTSVAILVSTLTKKNLYAGVGIFTIIFFSSLIAEFFSTIIHDNFMYVSIWTNFQIIADDWSGIDSFYQYDWYISSIVVLAFTIVPLVLTWRMIKRVEVI